MIRYRTREYHHQRRAVRVRAHHRKIGRLLGRTDDMLIIRGVNVFPSQIDRSSPSSRRSPPSTRSSSP